MVRIVTDSTADIPAEMAARLGITVVPCYVVFGTESYQDGVDLSREQFYEKLTTTAVIPTTAAPPPALYEQAYRQLAQETDEIVSIHLAARLSALYSSACKGAENVPQARIALVDSEQVTMGCGWLAVAAAEAARQGATLDQIVALVEEMKQRSWVLAVLDTLDFVYRGGRVSWVRAMLGTLLHVKPILAVRHSEVRLLERARTLERSLGRLVERVQALGPLERAIVLYANTPDRAELVADRLQALGLFPGGERLISQAGVTIASHAGPGAVGIACITAR